jgi:O-antigen ligase
MFALPGIVALIFTIYVRPQEVHPDLQRLPLLYMFFALAIFGLAVDLRLRVNKFSATPQLPFAILLFLWSMVATALNAPDTVVHVALEFAVPVTLYVVMAHSVHTFRALQIVTGTVLVLTILLGAVAAQQGVAPWGCVRVDPQRTGDITIGEPDGRSCRPLEDLDCYLRGEPEPGADYVCEHVGMLGTTSVAGRVRYRGVLQDPNELALALGIGLPLAFAFAGRRRSGARVLMALGTFALVAIAVHFTASRGGLLVLAAVIGVYALYLWRWKAGIVMAVLGPVVLFFAMGGGDSGRVDAASSTEERYEAWAKGIQMFRDSPLFGVGHGQFVEHHYLTAHNSYILALAELGVVGMLLWGAVLYLTVKIPLVAVIRYRGREEAKVARVWALGLLAALGGLMVGIFFLSFSWHLVFWAYVGLSGAYYSAVRTHDPDFSVRMTLRDWFILVALSGALVFVLFTNLRLRGY